MPEPATHIGRYPILRTIGRGGMGTVVLGRDTDLQRLVAIKVLSQPESADLKRFYREARLMAELQHPHLLPILDIGSENDSLYLVTPYMAGGSLDSHLATFGPLPHGQAASILRAIALALGAMHRQGVIHRDVKPSNILLSQSGDPYLGDMGISWKITSTRHSQTGTFSGTLGYLAPELMDGSEPTPAADVYSLGAVGYFLLSGQGPFDGGNLATMVNRLVNGQYVPLTDAAPDAPASIIGLVQSAMSADPSKRPQQLEEWADRLPTAVASNVQPTLPIEADTGPENRASVPTARDGVSKTEVRPLRAKTYNEPPVDSPHRTRWQTHRGLVIGSFATITVLLLGLIVLVSTWGFHSQDSAGANMQELSSQATPTSVATVPVTSVNTTTGAPATTIPPATYPPPPTTRASWPSDERTCRDGGSGYATVTEIRTGKHDDYDRLVFEFSGGIPNYTVMRVGTYIRVGLSATPASGSAQRDLASNTSALGAISAMDSSSGDTSWWDISAVGSGCPSVSSLGSPPRLVIDVAK